MAHVVTETIVITVSKLVKDQVLSADFVSADVVTALESVVEELVGNGVIVEATKA